MTKRLLPVAFVTVLGLFAAACSKPPQATISVGAASSFVPQVADHQDDVGLFPSVATDQQGTPYVAYFGFPQKLAEGQIAAPRPIGSPSVPSVDLVSVDQGIWTRGAVAMEKDISNVTVPFGPAVVPQVKDLTPDNANGTSIAVDDTGGFHVAWVDGHGVWYAQSSGSSFSASEVQRLKPPAKQAGPLGAPSVAVVDGTPWVTYVMSSAKGDRVTVAHQQGTTWKRDVLTTVPAGGSPPPRAAIAAAGNEPVVLFADGSGVRAATLGAGQEGGWAITDVEGGATGVGISLTSADDGLHAAYYADGEVHTATSKDGSSWQVGTVGSVGSGGDQAGRSTGIGVDSSGAVYVTWYDPGSDSVALASASDGSFSPLATRGTRGGQMPSLAVTPDGSAVYVAWYDPQVQDLMVGTYGDTGGLALAQASPTPTGGAAATTPPPSNAGGECTQTQNGKLTVTAEGIAFDTSCIQIPAGQKVTITFDNKDAGVQHNIAVFPSENDLTKPMFRGDLVTGPDSVDYTVGPFDAGTYYFHCDVHPTMNGTFKVVSAGGGGGGSSTGGGQGGGGAAQYTSAVSAKGIQFDTSTITLPANKATTLTFDNQDAGIQHNIAIFPSESDLTNPLFRGDLVTGPNKVEYQIPALKPGTYYFHCDVHPTMNGQVVVK